MTTPDTKTEPDIDVNEAKVFNILGDGPLTLAQQHEKNKLISAGIRGAKDSLNMMQGTGVGGGLSLGGEELYAKFESCALVLHAFNDLKEFLVEAQDMGALDEKMGRIKLTEFQENAKLSEADKESFLADALLILDLDNIDQKSDNALENALVNIQQMPAVLNASENAVPREATMSTAFDSSNKNISYGVRVKFTAADIDKLGFAGDTVSNQKLSGNASLTDSNTDIAVSEIFERLHNDEVSAQMVFDAEGYPISMFISAEETPESPYLGTVGFYIDLTEDIDPEKMSAELCYRMDQRLDSVVVKELGVPPLSVEKKDAAGGQELPDSNAPSGTIPALI